MRSRAQEHGLAVREPGRRARQQRRLADTGLALDEHHPRPARRGAGEHLRKQPELPRSPYKRLTCERRACREIHPFGHRTN
jgi:hypothetical protein